LKKVCLRTLLILKNKIPITLPTNNVSAKRFDSLTFYSYRYPFEELFARGKMSVERTTIEWQLNENSREKLRRAVLMKWAEELPGASSEEPQRYRYNVEKFPDSGMVYLHRPAYRNKGCDFIVNCEPHIPWDSGRNMKNPRHKDLINELIEISKETSNYKAEILSAIEDVWGCKDVEEVCRNVLKLTNDENVMFRMERALKVAKWLFIEQDITDWNTSGRGMLMDSIREELNEH